jgi:hypothetical protein
VGVEVVTLLVVVAVDPPVALVEEDVVSSLAEPPHSQGTFEP